MYLAYKPPEMLPTQTLNPTATASGAGTTSTGKTRRSPPKMEGSLEPMSKDVIGKPREYVNPDKWWWIGVGMTALGGIGYYCF